MIWLLNNNKTNSNEYINFYQIFVESEQVYSDNQHNIIYAFNSNKIHNNTINKFNFELDKYDNIECKIQIMDHIISYDILTEKKKYTFTSKTNFIKPTNNKFNVPIFSHSYKSVSNKKLPNLIDSEYTYSSILNFKIYNFETNNNIDKIQYIIETNNITNTIKKYIITNNLNLIEKYYNNNIN